MDRKTFLKTSLLGAGGLAAGISAAGNSAEVVGTNHINVKNPELMENAVLHRANTRGVADLGWLKSKHTFSFSHYHNPERMNFGVLRVLNDDIVAPGMGFGRHPHADMEIISIPLEGDLLHQDSMGNKTIIKRGDVQVMSAGTGVEHSEYNANKDREVRFLQIWIIPNKRSVTPRYDQITLTDAKNTLSQILSPNADDEGVWIHQDAWFHLGRFTDTTTVPYSVKKSGNGVYVFVLKGNAIVNQQDLSERDGYGIWNADKIEITASADSELLVMDVPMKQSL